MKVYTLTRTDLGGGYTVPDLDYIAEEIGICVDEEIENLKDLPIVIKEALLPELLDKLENAQIGEKFDLEMFRIEVREMDEEEYNSLPEFSGW